MMSKLVNISKLFKIDRFSSFKVSQFCNKIKENILEEKIENLKNEETNKSRFSNWTGKNKYKLGLLMLGLSGLTTFGYSLAIYGPPPTNEDGTYKEDEFGSMNPILAYPCRVIQNFRDFNQTIQDPISDKLLPDAHPQYHPMTLVIESNDILLHPEWTYKSGWKFKKRPGLELFLDAVSPFFEVVIFTNDSAMNLHPILHQLDPNFQKMHYRLYREATRYRNGVHIKDLSTLNRDLNKVIRVDWDKKACSMQPKNTFLIKRWKGDMSDRELIDLAAFLRMIATNNLSDVREGLAHYANFEDPLLEFRQRCEHLKTHMKKAEENVISRKSKSTINEVIRNLKRG